MLRILSSVSERGPWIQLRLWKYFAPEWWSENTSHNFPSQAIQSSPGLIIFLPCAIFYEWLIVAMLFVIVYSQGVTQFVWHNELCTILYEQSVIIFINCFKISESYMNQFLSCLWFSWNSRRIWFSHNAFESSEIL